MAPHTVLIVIMLILGFLAFGAATLGRFAPYAVRLIALGLALWIGTYIINTFVRYEALWR